MGFHELAGLGSVLCLLFTGGLYVRDTVRGKTRPHIFSWVIWGLINGIACVVAYVGGAMVSALTLAAGSILCLLVAGLSLRYGEKTITRSDWATFLAALCIIPLWILTQDPLVVACLVSLIDVLGFYPTLRKAWAKPHEENLRAFVLYCGTWLLSLLAVTPFTLVTGLYPSVPLCTNTLLVFVLIARRRVVK